MSEPDLEARALGAYLGFAIGDALGASVEFMSPDEIRGTHGVHRRMIGGGWLRLAPGAVTDDTQMSLALGDAIVREGRFVLRSVAEAFVAWLRSDPVDCGHTCRRGIRRYMLEGTLSAAPNERDAGNGALMRNLPVVLASLGDDHAFMERTLAQCRFTHHHPHSDAASLYLGRMTSALLEGRGVDAARVQSDALVQAHVEFEFADYGGRATAYVVDSVRTVLSQFFAAADFESAIVNTVNRGDDADTTGALVGMLAGARFGVAAIPRAWLTRLDGRVRVAIEAQVPALLALSARGRGGSGRRR